MKNKAYLNYAASLAYQLSSLVVGLILPRYYIEIFGSTYNGLNQTITQVMSLLAILQYGIAASSIQAMFRPIAEGNKGAIKAIYQSSAREYRKMGYIFLLAISPIIFLYPFFLIDQLSYWIIVIFFVFRGISSAMEYFFQAKYSILLIANNRSYAIYTINTILLFIGFGFHLTVLFTVQNIILYQFVAVGITFLRLFVISTYIKRKFPFIDDKNVKTDKIKIEIKDRKDVFVSEVAGLAIDSTDLVVLSIFASLLDASIYSVYNFVMLGLSGFLGSAREAVIGSLGRKYYSDKAEFSSRMSIFESLYIMLSFAMYSIAILMFKPFILLYTAGMDAQYFYAFLPLMFVVPKLLVSMRIPAIVAINISGHFKQVKKFAVTEAFINIALSLLFVKYWGIYGVLGATIIAASYRTPILIYYTYRNILFKRLSSYSRKIWPWMILFAISTAISFLYNYGQSDFLDWFGMAVVSGVSVFALALLILFLSDKNAFIYIAKPILKNI